MAIDLGMVVLVAAPAQAKNPPRVNPTHLPSYRVSSAPKLKPASLKLQDQFGASDGSLGKAVTLSTPVSKNGKQIKDNRTHLTCHTIKPIKSANGVVVVHQFGKQALSESSSHMLCLPSLKEAIK